MQEYITLTRTHELKSYNILNDVYNDGSYAYTQLFIIYTAMYTQSGKTGVYYSCKGLLKMTLHNTCCLRFGHAMGIRVILSDIFFVGCNLVSQIRWRLK